MIVEVILKWAERDQKWAMSSAQTGRFLYDFWDCDNFNRFFRRIDKAKENHYVLTVQPASEVKDAQTAADIRAAVSELNRD